MKAGRATVIARYRLRSGSGDVARVLDAIARDLSARGFPEPYRDDVRIVLAEVLNNIEEHAYGGRPGNLACLTLRLGTEDLVFRITDRGRAMPAAASPEGDTLIGTDLPRFDPMRMQDWPEGGFGWALVRRLATRVTYRRQGGSNRLEIVMTRPG